MSKRSDDQRKAMFANLNKGSVGKKKSKRLKRPKQSGSPMNRTRAFIRKLSGKKSLEEIRKQRKQRELGFDKLAIKTAPHFNKLMRNQFKQGSTDGMSGSPMNYIPHEHTSFEVKTEFGTYSETIFNPTREQKAYKLGYRAGSRKK